MKYVMLIYQGEALERQAALSKGEQTQVYADYQKDQQVPGRHARVADGSA
ncbi:MAG: hypothetical protein ACRDVP_09920 [Acidimicrobiales bacterium]